MRRERERARRLLGFVEAVTWCEKCGSPICPACEVEASWCWDCGAYHCESCGRYVDGGVRTADRNGRMRA